MIIAFVLDTGIPVSAAAGAGVTGVGASGAFTALDFAKTAVEHIMKQRSRGNSDQYLLLTTEEGSEAIKSGWGEPPSAFESSLKTLVAKGNTTPASLGQAISQALRLLNQHRMASGVDNWGHGRKPWHLEPGAVVVVTDGAANSDATGSDTGTGNGNGSGNGGGGFAIKQLDHAGAELGTCPWRWDQRIFTLFLRSTTPASNGSSSSGVPLPALQSLCERTGGWSGVSNSLPRLIQNLDMVLHRLQMHGPVVELLPLSEASKKAKGDVDDATSSSSRSSSSGGKGSDSTVKPLRVLLSVRGNAGNWPLPETFWTDRQMDQLPPRTQGQPEIYYKQAQLPGPGDNTEPEPEVAAAELVERLGLAIDWYDMEWVGPGLSPALGFNRSSRWPVYIPNSSKVAGPGEPFGFLRASPVAGRSILVLLPYNFPTLMQLMKQAVEMGASGAGAASGGLSQQWRTDFKQYVWGLPAYYYAPLRKALKDFGLQGLVPERVDGGLSKTVQIKLKMLKERCQIEAERLGLKLGHGDDPSKVSVVKQEAKPSDHPAMGDTQQKDGPYTTVNQIPIGKLVEEWEHMRAQLFGSTGATTDGLFKRFNANGRKSSTRLLLQNAAGILSECAASLAPNKTITEMSNYMEHLLKVPLAKNPEAEPEPDEDTPQGELRRRLMVNFGNPFKALGKGQTANILSEAADEAAILTSVETTEPAAAERNGDGEERTAQGTEDASSGSPTSEEGGGPAGEKAAKEGVDAMDVDTSDGCLSSVKRSQKVLPPLGKPRKHKRARTRSFDSKEAQRARDREREKERERVANKAEGASGAGAGAGAASSSGSPAAPATGPPLTPVHVPTTTRHTPAVSQPQPDAASGKGTASIGEATATATATATTTTAAAADAAVADTTTASVFDTPAAAGIMSPTAAPLTPFSPITPPQTFPQSPLVQPKPTAAGDVPESPQPSPSPSPSPSPAVSPQPAVAAALTPRALSQPPAAASASPAATCISSVATHSSRGERAAPQDTDGSKATEAARAVSPTPMSLGQAPKEQKQGAPPQMAGTSAASSAAGQGEGIATAATTGITTGTTTGTAAVTDPAAAMDPHDYTLPEGWIVCKSRRENRFYFFNTGTNQSLWTPPPGSVLKAKG
ncbi:unnamed protein product [Chrysoparadoxa australica]